MQRVQNGIWSGIFSTSAMTLGFLRFYKMLNYSERSPLPPGTISSQLTHRVGIDQQLSSRGRENAALLSHFGYGIACSTLYSMLPPKMKKNPILTGVGFACAVWSLSYFGVIPALNLRAAGKNMPIRRNALMLAAHVIWGAALGFSERELRKSGNEIFDGHRHASQAE